MGKPLSTDMIVPRNGVHSPRCLTFKILKSLLVSVSILTKVTKLRDVHNYAQAKKIETQCIL